MTQQPMAPIRILVVDDSVVIRKVLCDVLATDAAVEVVGTAADGRIALAKIGQLKPDLITLDVEMPNFSGLQTIPEIRKLYPKLPIIMFSTLTERGASTTLEALSLGATDYVTKPSNTGSLEGTVEQIRQHLLPKIRELCGFRTAPPKGPNKSAPPGPGHRDASPISAPAPVVVKQPLPRHPAGGPIDILAIGTSTGGPNALAELLPAIPSDFPVPIVIVQHMPPIFTRTLADRLNSQAAIEVREGQANGVLEPGKAWIAPGDYHMTVERSLGSAKLAMNQGPPENSCRPAVDVLFRSVAAAFGPRALAVVLTGMGSDGVLGSQAIREKGGRVLIQDEASSVVWGMPGQVAAAGLQDAVFPLSNMAGEIDRQVRMGRLVARRSQVLVPGSSG